MIDKERIKNKIISFMTMYTKLFFDIRFSANRKKSKAFSKQFHINPYSDMCIRSLKLYQNNDVKITRHPVLYTLFPSFYRFTISKNGIDNLDAVISHFEKECEPILTNHSTAIYAYAAILYFISLIHGWFNTHIHPKYGDRLAWCLIQEDYWATKLVNSLCIINDNSFENIEINHFLYDKLLKHMKLYNELGFSEQITDNSGEYYYLYSLSSCISDR